MGSIKRNYSGWAVLPVVAGILLVAAAVMAEGRSTSCIAQCPNRKGLTACLYRCWFGRTPLHLDLADQESTQDVVLLTASEAECAAYCKTHARDLPGKYSACMVMCRSRPDAADDKILHINDGKEEEMLQEDVKAQLGTTACDECRNTTEFMEYMSCLIRNNCD
ncbi:hypothetical protein CFC21_106246 [Triticum aestivum]|uniref:Uncharacterized protein n=2 Tax=Triticum aestivum TaxID=4565 RepID=A0A9R1N996_WHEAT|nr:hypothetical protein CFC21_106246 [Triticum aestivum]